MDQEITSDVPSACFYKYSCSPLAHGLQHQTDWQNVQDPNLVTPNIRDRTTFIGLHASQQSKYRHIPSCLLSLYLYCVNEAAYSKSVPLVTSLTIHEHAFVQEQPCAPYTCPSLPSFPLSPLPFQLLSCWVSFHFYYFRHRVFWLIFFNNPVVFCQYLLRSASSDFISRCLLFYVLRLWLTPSDRQGFLNKPFNRRQL